MIVDLELAEHWQRNPLEWIDFHLGATPWEKQSQIMESVRDNRFTICMSGNGVGKTEVAGWAAHWFNHSFPNSGVVITASSAPQIRNITWARMRKMHQRFRLNMGSRIFKTPATGMKINEAYDPEWGCVGLSPDDEAGFHGFHQPAVMVIIEECQAVDRKYWEALMKITQSPQSRILAVGNPQNKQGADYSAFNNHEMWNAIHISCLEHPNVVHDREIIPGAVTRQWVEERKKEWGEDSPLYRGAVLGEYPETDDEALVQAGWLHHARREFLAEYAREQGAHEVHMGLDVSRGGSDFNAMVVRVGYDIVICERWQQADTMRTIGKVVRAMQEFEIPPENVHVDDGGLGGPMVDRFIELGYNVDAVSFGAKPLGGWNDLVGQHIVFPNRRTELYWVVRCLLEQKLMNLRPGQERLMADLAAHSWNPHSKGHILLHSKEKVVKPRLGRSPDEADALICSFSKPAGMPEFAVTDYEQEEPEPEPDDDGKYVHETRSGSRIAKSY